MTRPHWLRFFQRPHPSANMILLMGIHPVLVDTGFGSDLQETERLLKEVGVPASSLSLIVNTHFHGDHVGGNYGLQQRYNLPIAAHRWEAEMVNRRDRDVCDAEWLNQPIEPYTVTRTLSEHDEISTGDVQLQVIHTPGHTLGHIALYEPREQVLVCGDTFHRDDVAWLGIFRQGAGALYRMMDTLDTLAQLPIHSAYSGHGSAMENPHASLDAARRRYEKWARDPEKIAWHACKRIFAYALMLSHGMTHEEITAYLLDCLWFQDYARVTFRCEPADFIQPLLDETLRARAAEWRDGRLMPLTAYNRPVQDWIHGPTRIVDWPKA